MYTVDTKSVSVTDDEQKKTDEPVLRHRHAARPAPILAWEPIFYVLAYACVEGFRRRPHCGKEHILYNQGNIGESPACVDVV